MRVGVKFCGHCQPQLDMVALLEQLKELGQDVQWERWSADSYDVLLVLQACQAACADIPDFVGPRVDVIGPELNFVEYAHEQELAMAVLAALRRACGA